MEETKVAATGLEAPDLSKTSISIDHVSVSYGENEVLHDVTFTVEPGRSIAIVGPSGSGKTTTMQALLGMLTPTSGDVLLGTQLLAKTDVTTYRSQIGYLSQNEQLLTGTVLENLSWGLKDVPATRAVEEALRQAEILEDIQALPQGVNTPVSEIGSNFSGGQAQRIGLARILLRNPSLLLLDEATSAMDSVVEYKVMQTLQEKLPQTTKVMIAHRLASVQNADEILFMEDGHITGKGTHKELLQTHPRYQEFVEKQMIEQ